MWQFVHDMPPGARRGASAGVFVNSLNPRRISSESFDLSSVLSVSGLWGNSQAAFMLIEAAMSGPVILIGDGDGGSAAGRLHAAKAINASANMMWRLMAGLTYHSTHHAETKCARCCPRRRGLRRRCRSTERHERDAPRRDELRPSRDDHRMRRCHYAAGGRRTQ